MSETSLVVAAKVQPSESSVMVMVGSSKSANSGDNLFSCVAKVASSLAAHLAGPDVKKHDVEGAPQQLKLESTAALPAEEIECDQEREHQDARQELQGMETLNDVGTEATRARNNWLELRARVQSVDPRVFAYETDPKYLQQCAEAKQRRAALTPSAPVWQP